MISSGLYENIFDLADQLGPFFMTAKAIIEDGLLRRSLSIEEKDDRELVTVVDRKINDGAKELIGYINKRFFKTDIPILGEEDWAGSLPSSENFWLVDPLDGTHNFVSGLPTYGVMVMLVENRTVSFAEIFLPWERAGRDGFYFAGRGKGAWRWPGTERLFVSHHLLEDSWLFIEGKTKHVMSSPTIQAAKRLALRSREGVASAYAWTRVASSGNLGIGAVGISVGNKPWDNLGGCLLVEEAGGVALNFDRRSWSLKNCRDLILGNKAVVLQI